MTIEKLLKVRVEIKKRKPTYKRVQSHQFAKLSETKWRRPKGMGNKVRRNRRGKSPCPQVGFGSPKKTKFLNKSGLKEILISNVSQLSKINSKTDAVVISSTVGGKKKLDILNESKKLNLNVSNFKNIDSIIKSLTKVSSKKVEKKVEVKKDEKKVEIKKSKEEKDIKKNKKELPEISGNSQDSKKQKKVDSKEVEK